uniref:NACHT domain-containing protein n=1 Tax=Anopheles culicifacies TaxID=139723 RepID=A0A182MHS1_9DIPT
MANKAKTDGVVFQQRLCYYVCGLVHREYEYSFLYEGDENTYGALDDVILRVSKPTEPTEEVGKTWLYCFQAKQTVDESKTLSIEDLLHSKHNVTKYMDSYKIYMQSEARKRDGTPTEMIYWTANDLHATSQKFVEKHTSTEPHLTLTIDSIKKYKITHWKALFMFDTAMNLANHCSTTFRKKDERTYKYLNESVADALAREILQLVDESTGTEVKVRFRKQFLQGAACLSDNAKQFRKSFVVACEKLHTNPNTPTYDIGSLEAVTFSTDAFNMHKLTEPETEPVACSFHYNGLDEQTLSWFFERFIFYACVPKDDRMVKAIKDLFDDRFNEEMFERYLIKEPADRAAKQPKKGKKLQQQQDCFIPKRFIESLMQMVDLKGKLAAKLPKGIEFEKESLDKLNENINCNGKGELTVLSRTKAAWTVARITKKLKSSLVVSNEIDFKILLEALVSIQSTTYGEWLISGEVQAIVLLDLPDSAQCSKQIAEQLLQQVNVIVIVSQSTLPDVVVDEVDLCDVIVDYDQLEIKCIRFDDKKLLISNDILRAATNSIRKIEELSTLRDITVQSDIYQDDVRHYIDRNLMGKDKKIVTHAELLSRPGRSVSIICDTAGQGKTTELLRIAKQAKRVDEIVCLYLRAKTIASGIPQGDSISSSVAWQMLLKLLYIAPRSLLVEEIVQQSLEKIQVCLLVDGFDEMMEQRQENVVKFLQKALQHAAWCSLVLAARQESLPILKKHCKTASYYSLASFSYATYFEKLWLSEPHASTPDLEKNVQLFISHFNQLLKAAGCKSFLEVPQLCKVMGTIYHERIRKPNIQWHTNYEIGSIYDAFVQNQFTNTLHGRFDKTDKLHIWAMSLISHEYYTKHAQLAYELEYNNLTDPDRYEQLQSFGLIMMMQHDSSKSVDFMHRTVMDYFLVRSCMLHDIDANDFNEFLKRYFCVSRANIADKFIDFFLEDAECLSPHKKRIISMHLGSESSINILPTCIRLALNNATFNTLGLLLSVATRELLAPLYFRFGGTDKQQGNEINLKRLGVRQTLLLLETLKKFDDEYADDGEGKLNMLERMLFEAYPDEEDTMEVAIRKPFPEVFDYIVAYCKEHLSVQIERYLTDRIPRYARTLISHCYGENKPKIIDKVLTLCKTTLHVERVQQCLQRYDLLGELIANIEIVPQGKEFKQIDRVDLTQKVLSLLDTYLDEESLITIKEQSRQSVETLQNEAVKSVLKQWMNVAE